MKLASRRWPAEGVGDERHIAEPRPRRHVGDVRQPQPVRSSRSEAPLDEIRGPRPGVAISDGGPLELAPAHATQPQVAHQPPDAVPADVDAFTLELGPHLVDAIDIEVLLMHPDDLRFELGITDSALRQRTSDRRVVGGGGELQDPADRLDPELLAVCRDVADYLAGRSSSAAKKADADFKMGGIHRSAQRAL